MLENQGRIRPTSLAGHSDYLHWCQLVRAFEVEVTLPRTSWPAPSARGPTNWPLKRFKEVSHGWGQEFGSPYVMNMVVLFLKKKDIDLYSLLMKDDVIRVFVCLGAHGCWCCLVDYQGYVVAHAIFSNSAARNLKPKPRFSIKK